MLRVPRPTFTPRRRQVTPPISPSVLGLTASAVLRAAEDAGDIEIVAQTSHVPGIGEVVRDVAVPRLHAPSPLLPSTPRRTSSAPDVATAQLQQSPHSISGQSTPQTPATPANGADDVRHASIGLSALAGSQRTGSRGRKRHARRSSLQALRSAAAGSEQQD